MPTPRFSLIAMLVMGAIGCSADNNLVGTNLTPSDAAAGAAVMPDTNASGGTGGGLAGAVGSGGVADGAVGSGGAAGEASGGTAGSGDSARSDGAVSDLPTRPDAAIDRGLGGDSPRIGDSSSDTATTCASLGESCSTRPCCGPLICQTSVPHLTAGQGTPAAAATLAIPLSPRAHTACTSATSGLERIPSPSSPNLNSCPSRSN
jgi:hypothetical protein